MEHSPPAVSEEVFTHFFLAKKHWTELGKLSRKKMGAFTIFNAKLY